MKALLFTASCFASTLLFFPVAAADEPKADKEQPAYELSLEVQALRTFNDLKLTDDQLKLVAKLAKETTEPARKRKGAKVSDEHLKALKELRDALVAADDDDKIGDLAETLDQLEDKPDLDDGYDITKPARKRTPELFKSFTATQLAGYYGAIADDVHEPEEVLMGALNGVRGLEDKEWIGKRDEIAEEVTWSVAGLDLVKADKIRDKVVMLLTKAHSFDAEEFKAKKADLEKEAKAIVGDIGPDTLLRNHMEHTLADMLSNPRLEAAVSARLMK